MDALVGGLGLIGGLGGLFGGNQASNVQLPPQQPVNLGPITGNIESLIPGLNQYNLGGQNLGLYQNYLSSALNNPYGQFGQSTANAFAGGGVGTGVDALANAGVLGGQVPGLVGAAGSILNTGFDPQNALYGRTLQQVTDQTGANLAQSGIGNTPWGQGVLGNTLSNFNIDWQNNLLNRQVTGAQGAEGLLSGAMNLGTGAAGLGFQGVQGGAQSGLMPFNTYNSIGGVPLSLLSGASQYGQGASAIPQTGIGDWLSLLQGANSANSVANQQAQLALQQQNQQFGQNAYFGNQIGQGLADLGMGFKIPNQFNFGGFGQAQA